MLLLCVCGIAPGYSGESAMWNSEEGEVRLRYVAKQILPGIARGDSLSVYMLYQLRRYVLPSIAFIAMHRSYVV